MERISFHLDNPKEDVRVRFRLRDGRKVQICHTSDIYCKLTDLAKLEPDGKPKRNAKVWNRNLSMQLKKEYEIITMAYAKMCDEGKDLTSVVWEREIAEIKSPKEVLRVENPNVATRFRMYADTAFKAGILSPGRHKHIKVVSDKLERFLIIKGISGITSEEFTVDHLLDFRELLFNEYLYIKKYPKLYKNVKPQNKPEARLSMNTIASQLKMLQTFFTDLENRDEITKSPFRRLGTERRKAVMKTTFDDPVFLRKDEFQRILTAAIPADLEPVRDAFLLQTALGCRIGDFQRMTMENVGVSDDNIPYIHYLPHKTVGSQGTNTEVVTPIVRFALDIIRRTGFCLPQLKNVYGESGYNTKIKRLLTVCKIDRKVPVYNEADKRNEYMSISSLGSSKLARKTHVDLMNKVQIDMYAAGLHKVGSGAVKRYTSLEIKDRFAIINLAFDQPPYYVDADLNIVE